MDRITRPQPPCSSNSLTNSLQPLCSLRRCQQQCIGDRSESQAGVVVIDDAFNLDSLTIHMQMPEDIFPVRRFDFTRVADVDNAAQFRAASSNDGLQQRCEIPTEGFLILFRSTGQVDGADSLTVVINTERCLTDAISKLPNGDPQD